jgi:hypothetical protein
MNAPRPLYDTPADVGAAPASLEAPVPTAPRPLSIGLPAPSTEEEAALRARFHGKGRVSPDGVSRIPGVDAAGRTRRNPDGRPQTPVPAPKVAGGSGAALPGADQRQPPAPEPTPASREPYDPVPVVPNPAVPPGEEPNPTPPNPAETPPEEPNPQPSVDLAALIAEVRKASPGLAVRTPEDLPEAFGQMNEELSRLRPLSEAVQSVGKANPAAVAFLDDLMAGTPVHVALKSHFPDLARDVEEGEADFAAYREREAEKRVRSEYEQKEAQARTQKAERWATDSQAAFGEFAGRYATDYKALVEAGIDLERVKADYLADHSPEHGRRFPGDHFDAYARGRYAEVFLKAEVEKARAEEREAVLKGIAAGTVKPEAATPAPAQDLPPTVAGAGAGSQAGLDLSALTPDERERYALLQALHGDGAKRNRFGSRRPLSN